MKMLTVMALSIFSLVAMAAEVDLEKSTLKWHGTKVTGEHHGKISLKSGKVELNKDGGLKSAEFVADMSSITNEDIESEKWRNKFLNHMKSADFFDVEKYPTAKLVVKKVNGKKVTADLTIKGKTNPVEFEYKKAGKNYKGKLEFDRTKYGMIYNSGNFFKDIGDKLVHDKVSLEFSMYIKDGNK